MREIEVKARVTDVEALKKELLSLGCVFSEPLVQKDRIFIHHSAEFSHAKGIVVNRIRDSNGILTFTLKKSLDNELDCIEKELIIHNAQEAADILTLMGYSEVVRVKKKRLSCTYKELTVCIDDVDDLGSFIEVEKIVPEGDLGTQEELFTFLESLGVSKNQRVTKGYDSLLYEKMLQ